MKIVWTRKAVRHLRASYDFWGRERSLTAADEMMERILNAVEMLVKFPSSGRPGRIAGTRELMISPLPFVPAYRVRRGKIEIIALPHGARKWPVTF